MKTWSEKDDLRRKDRELALVAVLGVAAAGEADDSNDISSAELFMLVFKRNITLDILGLCQDLKLGVLSTKIVEDQLVARRPLVLNTSRDLHGDIWLLLTLC